MLPLWHSGRPMSSLDDGNFLVLYLPLFRNRHYTRNDNLRSMKGRLALSMAPRILFLSQLIWRDGVACIVATCHALIGWTWACFLTRLLVFPCLSFLEAFISLSLSSFFFIFPISSISEFLPSFELRPIYSFFFGTILSSFAWFFFPFPVFWCLIILRLGAFLPLSLFSLLV